MKMGMNRVYRCPFCNFASVSYHPDEAFCLNCGKEENPIIHTTEELIKSLLEDFNLTAEGLRRIKERCKKKILTNKRLTEKEKQIMLRLKKIVEAREESKEDDSWGVVF